MRALLLITLSACATQWHSGRGLRATKHEVSAALGEQVAEEPLDPDMLPNVRPPLQTRPCCTFGMDLEYAVGAMRLRGLTIPNIIAPKDLGPHGYDNGALTLSTDLAQLATIENNGIVFTCRGGFVDTAHVRDNADLTLFFALKFAAGLPNAMTVEAPGDGTKRTVQVDAMKHFDEADRWETAIALAQWTVFELSIWHELATWFGYETVAGFSEKVSAFTPEDLYSNALGIRIGGGIIRTHQIHSPADWASAVDAWLHGALDHLGAANQMTGRDAMRSIDGTWWDSHRTLDDWHLVMKRNVATTSPITPWRPRSACDTSALPLQIPQDIAHRPIASLVHITLTPDKRWSARTQLPASLTPKDFPALIQQMATDMKSALGEKALEP